MTDSWDEVLDWERWAKEVLTDWRVPFDNHKVGLRLGITQQLCDLRDERDALRSRLAEAEDAFAIARFNCEAQAEANIALEKRLAEAEHDVSTVETDRLLREYFTPAAREEHADWCVTMDSDKWRTQPSTCDCGATASSAEAVQPERCCLDYPRCDCNSPPEPDNAPTLQPCGHPWKAQHDSKCILCSSPGVTP